LIRSQEVDQERNEDGQHCLTSATGYTGKCLTAVWEKARFKTGILEYERYLTTAKNFPGLFFVLNLAH